MRNLYYLKDIALDALESRKAELKNDDKNGHWFLPLTSKLRYISVSEITQTDIRDTLPRI